MDLWDRSEPFFPHSMCDHSRNPLFSTFWSCFAFFWTFFFKIGFQGVLQVFLDELSSFPSLQKHRSGTSNSWQVQKNTRTLLEILNGSTGTRSGASEGIARFYELDRKK